MEKENKSGTIIITSWKEADAILKHERRNKT
jgi:hypothetical protein